MAAKKEKKEKKTKHKTSLDRKALRVAIEKLADAEQRIAWTRADLAHAASKMDDDLADAATILEELRRTLLEAR